LSSSPFAQGDNQGWDTVLVVDFGAQYAQLIARRLREAHVFSEIVPPKVTLEEVRAKGASAIVLSGGPASVWAPGAPDMDARILGSGLPILGICYGAQLLAARLGGEVARTGEAEYGRCSMEVMGPSELMDNWPASSEVWMSHTDAITQPPPGARITGRSKAAPVAAFEDPVSRIYGVQFHPEVLHTPRGQELLEAFLHKVCGCRAGWTNVNVIEAAVKQVRSQVGGERAICALSGGVDSAVAAALVQRAIGSQLTCVFVDTGLMRAGEGEQVERTFREGFDMDLVHVDASEQFFSALKGLEDPEEKRKAIGREFIRVFEEAASKVGKASFLVQGTLYPDVVESGGGRSATIKSHHNVGGLPEDLSFELVEPLRLLFKDEVRSIGEELGLPRELVWRQPFPGPGLAVRVIGEVTQERVEIVRAADAILLEEVNKAGLYQELWQSFAVLPVVRTVGVMGDERSYAYPIVIRAVTSEDAMTADWARLPYEFLDKVATRIVNEVPGVNRVALDVTSKPPGTIEWE